MALKLHTLDVFTERRFGGNPLAVVHDADALDGKQMQMIARELNLSETVFLLKPANPAHSAKVRIFTPGRELPFAGHPTIGTAILLAELRETLQSTASARPSSHSSRRLAPCVSVCGCAPARRRSPNSTRRSCRIR